MTMINPPCQKQHFIPTYGYESFIHMSRLEEDQEAADAKGYEFNYHRSKLQASLGSDKPMAEDESRTESINETSAASSKDTEKEEEGWLQLSIGGSHEKKPPGGRLGLVELDLLPPGPAGGATSTSSNYEQGNSSTTSKGLLAEFRAPAPPRPPFINTSLFLQHPTGSSSGIFQQEINWGLMRPVATGPSSSSFLPIAQTQGLGSQYFSARPFPLLQSIDFRVIDPPRRPHSGLWFSLQASLNQAKEPFLQQISKSYLRIKDGRMTIRLVLKYLVNKLQLENESEIELTCRGQQVQPFLTLQHVRDHIWSNSTTLTLLPPQSSSASNHVMVLHYGRSAAS